MTRGIGQTGVRAMRVELVVDAENTAAQRVTETIASSSPAPVTDQATGRPALLYSTTLTQSVH